MQWPHWNIKSYSRCWIIILSLVLSICSSSDAQPYFTHHRKQINQASAKYMVDNYNRKSSKDIMPETYAVWFDSGVFYRLLRSPKTTGIRVYFARYSPHDHANRNSVVLVNTRKNILGVHTDSLKGARARAVPVNEDPLERWLENDKRMREKPAISGIKGIDITYNEGSMAPPFDKGVELIDVRIFNSPSMRHLSAAPGENREISTGRARGLVQNYNKRYYIRRGAIRQTTSVWFHRDDLTAILNGNYNGNKVNGIRIYFGNTTKDSIERSNTFILVGTYFDKDGNNRDLPGGEVNEEIAIITEKRDKWICKGCKLLRKKTLPFK